MMQANTVVTVGSCVTDLAMNIVEADSRFAELVSLDVRTLRSRNVMNLTHPDDREVNEEQLARLRAEGRPFAITKRYVLPDGSVQWVRNHVSLAPAGRGPQRLTATVEAVTKPIDAVPTPLVTAVEVQRRRQIRAAHFGNAAFSDTALDMLLYMYVQEHGEIPVTVTSCCAATLVPYTTALRHLARLERDEMVARAEGNQDKRIHPIHLTARGRETVCNLLHAIQRAD